MIWRLPHRGREVMYLGKRGAMTLSWPPSHCPMCDAPIQWYQNVPVLSYVLLRGRCANCKAAIPIRYPLVELAVAVIWGGLYVAYFVGHVQGRVPWMHGAPIMIVGPIGRRMSCTRCVHRRCWRRQPSTRICISSRCRSRGF